MADKKLLSVGELAQQMNVTVRTLQYYDREGLLKPSALSVGGRRLYSSRDVIRLHQILSLKYLGFSLEEIKNKVLTLDTPEEMAAALEKQQVIVEGQIQALQSALSSIAALRREVLQMNAVNFDKYADIITLLKMNNEHYWILKLFDDTLTDHVRQRFVNQPELGLRIFETYQKFLEEGVALKRQGERPDSEKVLALAKRWWDMIVEFTGGDMSLLPNLMEFNADKSKWDVDMAAKQQEVDGFIGEALYHYFVREGISFPGEEG